MAQTWWVLSLQGPGLFLRSYLHLGRRSGSKTFVIGSVAKLCTIKRCPGFSVLGPEMSAGPWCAGAGVASDPFPGVRAGRGVLRGRRARECRGCGGQDGLRSRPAAALRSRGPGTAALGARALPAPAGPRRALRPGSLPPAPAGRPRGCSWPWRGRSHRPGSRERRASPPRLPGLEGAEGQAAAAEFQGVALCPLGPPAPVAAVPCPAPASRAAPARGGGGLAGLP